MCRSEILWHIGLQKKSVFYKNRANSISLTPNPFPVVKGCVCFVGSASCRAFGHTRPASLPGLSVGLPPLTKQGCLQSATQSHGTMQWHKWLTTCTGAPPLRPHFYQRYSFFDRLNVPQWDAVAHNLCFSGLLS